MQIATVKKAGKGLSKRQMAKVVVAAALAVGASASMAAGLDMTPINNAVTTITEVGTLVFTVVVTIKTFMWIRRSL